jgi:hypothetical protein
MAKITTANCETMSKTSDWLRELGAVRPMGVDHVLVLGEWHEGYYPIEWKLNRYSGSDHCEQWRVFGIETAEPLTTFDVDRIMRALKK